jgi:uncharacterized membrane protein
MAAFGAPSSVRAFTARAFFRSIFRKYFLCTAPKSSVVCKFFHSFTQSLLSWFALTFMMIMKTVNFFRTNVRTSMLAVVSATIFVMSILVLNGCLDKEVRRFRCIGNEPSWAIVFSTKDSLVSYTTVEGTQDWKRGEYSLTSNGATCTAVSTTGRTVQITLRKERCSDTMSGKEFEYSATLTFDGGKALRGCAEEVQSLNKNF